jgi:hypothetical protein
MDKPKDTSTSLRDPEHGKHDYASMRFCINCEKVTKFVLNQGLKHSCCEVCEGPQALHPNNAKEIAKVLRMGGSKYLHMQAVRSFQRKRET